MSPGCCSCSRSIWIVPIIFNITFQNFLVIVGAANVAIGFAFKDCVSSLIAGVVGIFERPYRPGDWVKVGGDYGKVRNVGLRATRHDAATVLQDVALTSAYLNYSQPVIVVLAEQPWGTHYKLRAYPYDMRDQFAFVSDLTVRGKLAIAEAGAREVQAMAMSPSMSA